MKRILSLCLVAIFLLSAATTTAQEKPSKKRDWAQFYWYEKANAKRLAAGNYPDVVFLGNSITQIWAGKCRDFFKENNFAGRGIGGQTTSEMLVRFRRDVIDLKPRAVVILAGINDIAHNNGEISLENIMGNIISMCELAKLHKIKVLLCSVTPAYEFRWRPEIDPKEPVIRLNAMIKEYAKKNKIYYVDYYSALLDERGGMFKKYHKDEVHPNKLCYAEVMEPIVLKAINKVLHTKYSYTTPIPTPKK
ncbi:MAG: acylhydrolase [Alistipes sp.]|nr:acylhydrolase [Alistipes sp.]